MIIIPTHNIHTIRRETPGAQEHNYIPFIREIGIRQQQMVTVSDTMEK
jgi:hypothetical protein